MKSNCVLCTDKLSYTNEIQHHKTCSLWTQGRSSWQICAKILYFPSSSLFKKKRKLVRVLQMRNSQIVDSSLQISSTHTRTTQLECKNRHLNLHRVVQGIPDAQSECNMATRCIDDPPSNERLVAKEEVDVYILISSLGRAVTPFSRLSSSPSALRLSRLISDLMKQLSLCLLHHLWESVDIDNSEEFLAIVHRTAKVRLNNSVWI